MLDSLVRVSRRVGRVTDTDTADAYTSESPITSKPNRIDRHLRADTNTIDQLSIIRASAFADAYSYFGSRYIKRSDDYTRKDWLRDPERTRPQSERLVGQSYRSQCLPSRNAPNERYYIPQPDLRSGTTIRSRIARLIPEGP